MRPRRHIEWSPIELVSRIVKSRGDVINMAGGSPDPDLMPIGELSMIAAEAASRVENLMYPGAGGIRDLRAALSRYCSGVLGIDVGLDNIVVTAGAQHGIKLVSQLVVGEGDVVVVENPTFYEGVDPFRFQGARLVGVPVDEDGLRTDVLERMLRGGLRPRLAYLVPTCHNPTGHVMSLERRRHMLELAEAYDFLILEDDPYRPISPDPPPALASIDRYGRVIYVGSLSKVLAPGLRVGFVIAPDWLSSEVEKLTQHDFAPSTLTQAMATLAISRGVVERVSETARRWYVEKLMTLVECLERHSIGLVQRPRCGFYALVRLGVDAEELLPHAISMGVSYVPARKFYVGNGPRDSARLSIGPVRRFEIEEGVRRLRHALDSFKQ